MSDARRRVNLASIILAGGASSRMGRPKASLPIAGTSLLLRTVETLLDCSWPVVVVARDEDQELPPLHTDCETIPDLRPGAGPLAGLETGLRWLSSHDAQLAFVCGCDQPYLTSRAVTWMADQLGDADDGVVCAPEGRVEPLASIWRCEVLEDVARLLAEGKRSVKALVDRTRPRLLGEAEIAAFAGAEPSGRRFYAGINTPEEYERARRDLEGTGG